MRVTLIELWGRGAMLHYVSQLANHLACLPDTQVALVLPRRRGIRGRDGLGRMKHPLMKHPLMKHQEPESDLDLFDSRVTLNFVDVVRDASMTELLGVPLKLLRFPQFLRTIRRTRPDVIHLNNCHVWYILALPWMRRRYPIVSTMHDVRPHPGQDDTWRKRQEIATLARLSHRIFVHGESLKEQLLATYPARTRDQVTVIPIGDFSFLARSGVRQHPADRAPGAEEKGVALFFGRIRSYKGLEYFIEAAKLVSQRIPESRFVIAGAGDLGPYQRSLNGGGSRASECVFETHNRYIPDSEVAAFFRRASIVVLPYTEASQSGVIPVAYAFGKPVVATRVGCLPDVVEDGRTGLLVPARDTQALADAMVRLLSDKKSRKTMGRNAHQVMKEKYGWDKIAATTRGAYEAAIREFRERPSFGVNLTGGQAAPQA